MHRRSLNRRFGQKVLDDVKFTTIREKPWPIGKPIMLFHWLGVPYRSKQEDLAVIEVEDVYEIHISNWGFGMIYSIGWVDDVEIWNTEGFDSKDEMNAWFSAVVKPGKTVTKYLMRFRRKAVEVVDSR